MWFCDLRQALEAVSAHQGTEMFCLKSVRPAWNGIVFETTGGTRIKWVANSGEVVEFKPEDWRD